MGDLQAELLALLEAAIGAARKGACAEEPPEGIEPARESLCTVTFYSFKGGVGRTLALLNVATLLAKLGNRVVIADVDLEAPGLDTYKGFEPPSEDQPGVLDFITDYTDSKSLSAPSCRDYLYCVFDRGLHRADGRRFGPEAKENPYFGDITGNGALYVMRAGRQDAAYRANLAKLDWDRLFAEQDGHLLFANLKNELFEDYGCSFLLLDSRTGLTDVAGVCTAFLPDAVVLMFFPDEQNARGIRTVASAIRNHAKRELRLIPRMYCVSRVPQIVERREEAWRLAQKIYRETDFRPWAQRLEFANQDDDTWWWIDKSPKVPAEARWDWESYRRTAACLRTVDAQVPIALRELVGLSTLAGNPIEYSLDSVGMDLELFSDGAFDGAFSGVPVCMIAERPSMTAALAALHGPGHQDCEPYISLTTFVACNSMFELKQLSPNVRFVWEEARRSTLRAIGEECKSLNTLNTPADPTLASELAKLTRMLRMPYIQRQFKYARKWHSADACAVFR